MKYLTKAEADRLDNSMHYLVRDDSYILGVDGSWHLGYKNWAGILTTMNPRKYFPNFAEAETYVKRIDPKGIERYSFCIVN